MVTARLVATKALLSVTDKQATLGSAIDAERAVLDDPRDRALALELTAGALRWRSAIDFVIEAVSGRRLPAIDRSALAILRIGVYQLRYLDRVPDHAVVSEAVSNARDLGVARAAGFVNAVLRQVIRRRSSLRLPAPPGPDGSRDAQLAYLTVTLSHPRWLVERWLDRIGYEATRAWCEWNTRAPVMTVRAADGTSRDRFIEELSGTDVDATPSPLSPDAIRLPPGTLGRLPAGLRERLWVQDEGALLVAKVAGVMPGERVLDICAAPGGKSLVMRSDLMSGGEMRGLLVSADHRRARVELLARTLRPSGPAAIVRLDARRPLPFAPVFDCVLIDVPCSGLGTLRRDPDLKWSRTPADLPALVETELAILREASTVVAPGGRLVYATCSSEPEENEAVVDTFLHEHASFAEGEVSAAIPASLVTTRGHLATRPDRDAVDAFFAAILVRR